MSRTKKRRKPLGGGEFVDRKKQRAMEAEDRAERRAILSRRAGKRKGRS